MHSLSLSDSLKLIFFSINRQGEASEVSVVPLSLLYPLAGNNSSLDSVVTDSGGHRVVFSMLAGMDC